MKNILISSFDMEVGGVERSLISMLENFDFQIYDVELLLYRQQGDFLNLVTNRVKLLNEIPHYATFRQSISETFRNKQFLIGLSRIYSKIMAELIGRMKKMDEAGNYQMQLMWRNSLSFLPKLEKEYDVAISYLWPHYFIANKVKAKKKIAWVHSDYSTMDTHINMDLRMWNKFDQIVAVSEACKQSFLKKYHELENKVVVIENITSPEFIRKMANEEVNNPMIHDKRFKIITLARLSHAKGIDNAVKALKILKEKGYENIAWYVVGYGGDEDIIKGLINECNVKENFLLLGKQMNPYPYIKEADLYVQPSRYEGKAVTVGEAQILAKPVMITNYPTAKSQLNDGFDGVITDLSIEGIVQGIEKMIGDAALRERLTKNCTNTNYSNYFELDKLYKIIEY